MRGSDSTGPLLAAAAAALLAVGACADGGTNDTAAFCDVATDSERFDTVFEDLDPSDVDAAMDAFSAARDTEVELREVAPEAVQADVGVMIRFFDDLLEGLESPEATADERPPVYDELRPRFDQVEAASDRIELYVSTNC